MASAPERNMSLSPTAGEKKCCLRPFQTPVCVSVHAPRERSIKQAGSRAFKSRRRSLCIWNAGEAAPPLTSPTLFRQRLKSIDWPINSCCIFSHFVYSRNAPRPSRGSASVPRW